MSPIWIVLESGSLFYRQENLASIPLFLASTSSWLYDLD